MTDFDYMRVKEWAMNPSRKPAVLSFTEGIERQVAYLIESLPDNIPWQIIDTMPLSGQPVLLCRAKSPYPDKYVVGTAGAWVIEHDSGFTHWAPLMPPRERH